MDPHDLQFGLGLVLGVAAVASLARRLGLPAPVLLVLAGLAAALIPATPRFVLDPDVVLILFLPPLLFAAAWQSSLPDFRANLRPIGLLSVGLVLFTAVAVGWVAWLLIPGLPFAAALALGAIVAPPDAVAATAVARRVGMPAKMTTILEGESLVNDATALTAYRVAVAAALSGSFSVLDAGREFLVASVGGVVVGLVVAKVVHLARRWVEDTLIDNTLILLTPFGAFLLAEEGLHASGVLAVVVAGLYLGHHASAHRSSETRLSATALWQMIVFLLENMVFALIGLQLPDIVENLDEYAVGDLVVWSAVVLAVVLVTRVVWVFPATYLPRLPRRVRARDPFPPWRHVTVVSWAGMRGVVSLAAAFALPLELDDGSPFPRRELLLFLTFVVVVGTLLLNGLTLAPLMRWLRIGNDEQRYRLEEAAAQQQAITASLRRLEELLADAPAPDGVAEQLRDLAQRRSFAAWERLGGGAAGMGMGESPVAAYRRLRRQMLLAESAEFLRLRNEGRLSEEVMRRVQRELDLEMAALARE
jgi:Na+/H+ antiporter